MLWPLSALSPSISHSTLSHVPHNHSGVHCAQLEIMIYFILNSCFQMWTLGAFEKKNTSLVLCSNQVTCAILSHPCCLVPTAPLFPPLQEGSALLALCVDTWAFLACSDAKVCLPGAGGFFQPHWLVAQLKCRLHAFSPAPTDEMVEVSH